MAKTDLVETQTLEYWLSANPTTRPTDWEVRLYESDPTDTGAAGTEVSDSGYTPQDVTFTITDDKAENVEALDFGNAADAIYEVSHVGIWDKTGTRMLYHSPLDSTKTIQVGMSFKFEIGDIKIFEE